MVCASSLGEDRCQGNRGGSACVVYGTHATANAALDQLCEQLCRIRADVSGTTRRHSTVVADDEARVEDLE
jgi:hypothetical protein